MDHDGEKVPLLRTQWGECASLRSSCPCTLTASKLTASHSPWSRRLQANGLGACATPTFWPQLQGNDRWATRAPQAQATKVHALLRMRPRSLPLARGRWLDSGFELAAGLLSSSTVSSPGMGAIQSPSRVAKWHAYSTELMSAARQKVPLSPRTCSKSDDAGVAGNTLKASSTPAITKRPPIGMKFACTSRNGSVWKYQL